MTITTTRGDATSAEADGRRHVIVAQRRWPGGAWRLPARLAWRETLRRPARTVLVLLVVALPVGAMTVGSALIRSDDTSWSGVDRDADASTWSRAPVGDDIGALVADGGLPAGTRWVEWRAVLGTTLEAVSEGGRVIRLWADVTDVPLDDPLSDELYDVRRGRAPVASEEVWLSEPVADRLGVDLGDVVDFVVPELRAEVVGVGRFAPHFAQTAVVVHAIDPDDVRAGRVAYRTSIDLPEPADADAIRTLGSLPRVLDVAVPGGDGSDDRRALAWGWVAGVVSLAVVGIVIAAAFATSAQRQLVTVGQLLANGAPPQTVRRSLSLQGLWTGLVGAIVGVVVGVAAIPFVGGRLEDLLGRMLTWRFVWSDLAVIIVTASAAAMSAATVPARTASRVPVLAALAGRRPTPPPPRWMGPLGVGSIVLGLVALAVIAGSENGGDGSALGAVGACLLVLFGLVCLAPLIIAGVGSVGSRFGGVVRLSARSLARSRMRSAALLSATAAVTALAAAGLVVLDRIEDEWAWSGVPERQVVIERWDARKTEVPDELRREVVAVVPGGIWVDVEEVVGVGGVLRGATLALATPALLDAIDASDGLREQLAAGRVAIDASAGGPVVVGRSSTGGVIGDATLADGTSLEVLQVRASESFESSWRTSMLIAPEVIGPDDRVRSAGFAILRAPSELTAEQARSLADLRSRVGGGLAERSAFLGDDPSPARVELSRWAIDFVDPSLEPPWTTIRAIGLAVAALTVLLVVAIGLALAAVESRDERRVLDVLGARRRTRVGLAAGKATVVTTSAVALGVPVGVGIVRVVSGAARDPLPVPWWQLAMLAVAVPVVTVAAAGAASAVASVRRARDMTAPADL